MAETNNLALPLLSAGQAQKHVTVNEALTRLDALAPGVCESASIIEAPGTAAEGAVYIVPFGGTWPGVAGSLCVWLNGGWLTVTPAEGWRVWVRDERAERRYRDGTWQRPDVDGMRLVEIDQRVNGGSAVETAPIIPDKAVVVGVTGRVIEAIEGTGIVGWSLGVPGAAGRYGSGYGLSAGSFAQGVTANPLAYYADTPLLVTALGGDFSAGFIRMRVHFLRPEPPV